MRSLLALTVVLNYLVILVAGNFLPQRVVPSAKQPYVHSKECQERNYLLLDCWDKCNDAAHFRQSAPPVPVEAAILLLTSLDVHMQPYSLQVAPSPEFASLSHSLSNLFKDCCLGYCLRVWPPPELG